MAFAAPGSTGCPGLDRTLPDGTPAPLPQWTPRMPFSLVIFDCDGVLIDSEILSAEVEAAELTRLGATITTEQAMRSFLGLTQADMELAIEREFGLRVPADHEETVTRLLMAAYKERLEPIP